jgi:tetratricopeptide (TPR) repeat protein
MAVIRISLVFFLSLLFFAFSDAGEISHTIDSINSLIKQTKGTKQQIQLLLTATEKLRTINPDDALICATKALLLADSAHYPELQLDAMIQVGGIKVIKTEFALGLEMALKAKDLAQNLNNDIALGQALILIGTIRLFQSNYSESLKNNFSALQLFEKARDNQGILQAKNGIGNVCYYQGDYDKAYFYYSSALNIAREIKDTVQIASMLNNVGLVLMGKGQLDKSTECFREAIGINSKLGLTLRLASNYMNLASVNKKRKHYDEFVGYYEKAVDIYIAAGAKYQLYICYIQFSLYYEQLNDRANQLKYALISFNEGTKNNVMDAVKRSSDILHRYYLKAGNIDSAYKYAIIANRTGDSINKGLSVANLKLLEMEYEYDKTQKEEKLKQQRKNFINIILIILAITGLIIAILLLSRQIVKTKNMQLEKQLLADEVEFKNKELTINVMGLIKKSELIVEISNRLIRMEHDSTDNAIKSEILQIVNSLQRNSNNNIWEEFEVRFRQVHTNFYEKLLNRFPELSPNELKLCALLRLNLSTKEICELTGQLPASLDMARYRLRKKLGLTDSTVNLVTFLSQVQ